MKPNRVINLLLLKVNIMCSLAVFSQVRNAEVLYDNPVISADYFTTSRYIDNYGYEFADEAPAVHTRSIYFENIIIRSIAEYFYTEQGRRSPGVNISFINYGFMCNEPRGQQDAYQISLLMTPTTPDKKPDYMNYESFLSSKFARMMVNKFKAPSFNHGELCPSSCSSLEAAKVEPIDYIVPPDTAKKYVSIYVDSYVKRFLGEKKRYTKSIFIPKEYFLFFNSYFDSNADNENGLRIYFVVYDKYFPISEVVGQSRYQQIGLQFTPTFKKQTVPYGFRDFIERHRNGEINAQNPDGTDNPNYDKYAKSIDDLINNRQVEFCNDQCYDD